MSSGVPAPVNYASVAIPPAIPDFFSASLAGEQRQILKVLSALLGSPFVAGLIFGAYQAVGPTTAIGHRVEVALGTSDAVLDMAPVSLDGLKNPGLALGIVEKAGQLGAVLTMAGERARAAPVGGRRQGLGDPRAQMRNTCGPQPLDRRRALCRAGADQPARRRNKNRIEVVGLGPGEDVVHTPFGQRCVNSAKADQQINDDARVYPGPALPWFRWRGAGRRVARQRLNQPGGRTRQADRALRPPSSCCPGQQIGAGPEGGDGRPGHNAFDQRRGLRRRQMAERGDDGSVVTLVVVTCSGDFGQKSLDQRRIVQPVSRASIRAALLGVLSLRGYQSCVGHCAIMCPARSCASRQRDDCRSPALSAQRWVRSSR